MGRVHAVALDYLDLFNSSENNNLAKIDYELVGPTGYNERSTETPGKQNSVDKYWTRWTFINASAQTQTTKLF